MVKVGNMVNIMSYYTPFYLNYTPFAMEVIINAQRIKSISIGSVGNESYRLIFTEHKDHEQFVDYVVPIDLLCGSICET